MKSSAPLKIYFVLALLFGASTASSTHVPDEEKTEIEKTGSATGAALSPVELINSELEKAWKANRLTPSKQSTDEAFLRRATLDILGRIPTLNEIQKYLKEPAEKRRDNLCDRLVDDEEAGTYWSKLWHDWLLELSPNQPTMGRGGLQTLLANRLQNPKFGWDKITHELLTASEGKDGRNGTDFLRESLGDPVTDPRYGETDMVPATNRTSHVFLGQTVRCAQCHDHPTDPRFTQQRYWELNAFFRQFGRLNGGARKDVPSLNAQGFIYYETPRGQQVAAYPRFLDGKKWDPKGTKSRREALAEFVTANQYFPMAFLNRVWGQFFGRGLNIPNPIDDLSVKNFALAPLMDGLAKHFKDSGYNIREAMRWICKSRPYGLASIPATEKAVDEGLFSFAATRKMNPEQLTDSLRVGLRMNSQKLRREAFHDSIFVEESTGDMGEINRQAKSTEHVALAMMNSTAINQAISDWVRQSSGSNIEHAIRGYYWSLFGRAPTPGEMMRIRREVRNREGLEDLISSMIISSEFQHNH